jgi:3-oxoacyl-[acyl-carrier-protein] synthase-3
MRYTKVRLETPAYALAPVVVTSAEIEETLAPVYRRLGLPPGRLELMSGIRERRCWLPGTLPSEAAAAAGRQALAASQVPAAAIGCLMMCSVSRDCLEPASATRVHRLLGLPEPCLVFDISNACLGILTGMVTAAAMIEAGHVQAALLVAGENARPLLDSTLRTMLADASLTRRSVKPHFASLTIGSGAVAVILAHASLLPDAPRLLGGASLAVTAHHDLCQGNADKGMHDDAETLMATDAEALLAAGVAVAERTWADCQATLGWDNATPDRICTHQVGSAHRRHLFAALGLPLDRDFPIVAEFGNTGSVACPMALARAVEAGFIAAGHRVALLGIGSGINCTMLGVEWT